MIARNRRWYGVLLDGLLIGLSILSIPAAAQNSAGPPVIQDNSFLVEEAYNQERGVVQHISTFSRLWNSKDWVYTFTQEWPMPGDARHQLSYTLVGAHAGAFEGSGAGLGDFILNYRYQLVGNGDTRTAFSPRVSMLLPSGDEAKGRGFGAKGVQVNLPCERGVASAPGQPLERRHYFRCAGSRLHAPSRRFPGLQLWTEFYLARTSVVQRHDGNDICQRAVGNGS